MHIEKVDLISFKGFENFSLDCSPFTALVGLNNNGKTSLLQAIQLVFEVLFFAFGRKEQPDYSNPLFNQDPTWSFQKMGIRGTDADAIWLERKTSVPCIISINLDNGIEVKLEITGRQRYNLDVLCNGNSIRSLLSIDENRKIIADLFAFKPVFVPPIGTVSPSETYLDFPHYNEQINKGRLAESWRAGLFWKYNGAREKFPEFVTLVKIYLPNVTLCEPKLSGDAPAFFEIQFKEKDVNYDISFSGGGLRTILNLISILNFTNSKCFLFDEPDAHLHGTLQRQIAHMMQDFVSDHGVQIITASHSPDFLSEIPSSNLVWIDRNEREGHKCSDLGAMLVDLGAITNTDAIRAYGADKVLFVEGGLDRKVYEYIFELFGQTNPFCDKSVIIAELPNGKGDKKYLKAFCELSLRTFRINAKIACVVDSDYAVDNDENTGNGVIILPLKRKEIENYLIEPELWQRALTAKTKQIDLQNTTTIIQSIIDNSKHKDIVKYQYKPKYRDSLGSEHDPATRERLADVWFEQKWTDEQWRLCHCPGKMVLSEIRKTIQEQYKVTVSNRDLINSMKILPDDLNTMAEKVCSHFYTTGPNS